MNFYKLNICVTSISINKTLPAPWKPFTCSLPVIKLPTASPPFPLGLVLGGGCCSAMWLMARPPGIGSAALTKGN